MSQSARSLESTHEFAALHATHSSTWQHFLSRANNPFSLDSLCLFVLTFLWHGAQARERNGDAGKFSFLRRYCEFLLRGYSVIRNFVFLKDY